MEIPGKEKVLMETFGREKRENEQRKSRKNEQNISYQSKQEREGTKEGDLQGHCTYAEQGKGGKD